MIKDDNKEKSEEKDIDKKKEDNIDNDNKIEKIELSFRMCHQNYFFLFFLFFLYYYF